MDFKLLLGLVRALGALAVLVSSCALANGVANDGRPLGAMDRHIDVASFDDLAVHSFVRRRVQHDAISDEDHELSLWGLEARSSLPVVNTRASFDYSVYMPTESDTQAFADEEHRLLRVSLQDRYRFMRFGGSVFRVGDKFLNQPLARERLNSTGLNTSGQGSEFWASGRLPLFGLQPTIRHIDVADELANSDLDRSSTTTTFALSKPIPIGSLFLRNVRFDEQTEQQADMHRRRWEVGGHVSAFWDISVSPMFAVERQFNAFEAIRATSVAGLNLHTRLADATVLDLRLHHNRHEFLRDAREQATMSADLAVSTPLRLWPRTPPGLTVSAALGYRGHEGVSSNMRDEGMSVRLSFNFQAGD